MGILGAVKKSWRVRSLDVLQADSLPRVRRVVEVVHADKRDVPAISKDTGFSERHVRYRLQAARILGLLAEDLSIAAVGRKLIETAPGSGEELETFRGCVRGNAILTALAPALLAPEELDVAAVSKRIQVVAGLSPATADRRAVVLRAWHRQLVETEIKDKELV